MIGSPKVTEFLYWAWVNSLVVPAQDHIMVIRNIDEMSSLPVTHNCLQQWLPQ